jgi:hypothetical protein
MQKGAQLATARPSLFIASIFRALTTHPNVSS